MALGTTASLLRATQTLHSALRLQQQHGLGLQEFVDLLQRAGEVRAWSAAPEGRGQLACSCSSAVAARVPPDPLFLAS